MSFTRYDRFRERATVHWANKQLDVVGGRGGSMISVAICIPTFKRPQFLGSLLESLVVMEVPDVLLHIIIVDNDEAGSAASVVDEFTDRIKGVVYRIEPRRGIASARNCLVATASELGSDYLVFIDDDEWVNPYWFVNLIGTARTYDADAVGGFVIPHYDSEVPAWIVEGGFFNERPECQTGEIARGLGIGMGNTLIKREWLEKIDGPFDPDLSLTGGEDPLLWMQLYSLGLQMIWCKEAIVHERIPASRAQATWILMRQFNYGISTSRIARAVNPSITSLLNRLARCVGRILHGILLLPISIPRGRIPTLKALQLVSRGIGGIVGLAGFDYNEYKQVHGR